MVNTAIRNTSSFLSGEYNNCPISAFVRAFSFNETFGFQFGEVLFDGFGGDSDDFGEFSGRIVGVNFEQLEDFLPTFSNFLTTY